MVVDHIINWPLQVEPTTPTIANSLPFRLNTNEFECIATKYVNDSAMARYFARGDIIKPC